MVEGKFYFNHIGAATLCPNPKSTVEYTILKRSQKNGGVLGLSQEDGKQLLSWMQKGTRPEVQSGQPEGGKTLK